MAVELIEESAAKEGDPRVGRQLGDCGFCGDTDLQVIESYDQRIYTGWACHTCILTGTTSAEFPPHSLEMQPIVFVAKALRGDEPFKSMLKKSDWQKAHPEEAAAQKAAAIRKDEAERQRKVGKRLGLVGNSRPALNRREKRQVARNKRKGSASG